MAADSVAQVEHWPFGVVGSGSQRSSYRLQERDTCPKPEMSVTVSRTVKVGLPVTMQPMTPWAISLSLDGPQPSLAMKIRTKAVMVRSHTHPISARWTCPIRVMHSVFCTNHSKWSGYSRRTTCPCPSAACRPTSSSCNGAATFRWRPRSATRPPSTTRAASSRFLKLKVFNAIRRFRPIHQLTVLRRRFDLVDSQIDGLLAGRLLLVLLDVICGHFK